MMFPPPKQGGDKGNAKPAAKGAPRQQGPPPSPGPGLHQALMRPPLKSGQGMDSMEAMMGGMGDMSAFAPPPPPQAPLGPDGLPVGGGQMSSDPGMDPDMGGSSLFKALNMGLDPYAAGPDGHGDLDPMPDLDTLIAMLAMQQSGLGGMRSPSGVMPDPTHPGEARGLQQFNVIQ